MLSQLDNIIFPDRCTVLEVAPQRYVYPIFKNGSRSLNEYGFPAIAADRLTRDDIVDVFVRDPYERFLSGVRSFLQFNDDLDSATVMYFVSNYLFLDTHYCPQYYWLVNLQRHTNAQMRFLPIQEIKSIVPCVANHFASSLEISHWFDSNLKVQFYLQLDKVLTEHLLFKTVVMKQINATIMEKFPEVHQEVIMRSKNICSVLD